MFRRRSFATKALSGALIHVLVVGPTVNAMAAGLPRERAAADSGVSTTNGRASSESSKPRSASAKDGSSRQPAAGGSQALRALAANAQSPEQLLAPYGSAREFLPQNGDLTTVASVVSARLVEAPAGVPEAAAWALFDGDPRTVLASPTGKPLRVEVQFAEPTWLTEVTGAGESAGSLRISVLGGQVEGPFVGASALIARGGFGPISAERPQLAQRAILEWTPGDEGGLSELQFWGVHDPSSVSGERQWVDRFAGGSFPGGVSFESARESAQVTGANERFEIEVAGDPRTFARAFVSYELEGAASFVGVPRRVNGLASRGTQVVASTDDHGRAGVQVEEIDPSWLEAGRNAIEFGALHGALTSYRVSHVKISAVPHAGVYAALPPRAWGAPENSKRRGGKGQARSLGDLELDSKTLPSSLGFRLEGPTEGTLVARAGSGRPLRVSLHGLSAGWHRYSAAALPETSSIHVTYEGANASALTDVRVAGSALPQPSTPALRISYPLHGECRDGRAYVRGFVAAGAGQIREISVDGRPLTAAELGADGSFELQAAEKPAVAGKWALSLHATLADGETRAQDVELKPCLKTEVHSASTPLVDEGAPYGEWVTPERGGVLHYAGAVLEVPPGAVSRATRITIRPLGHQASAPSRGLVDVLPSAGSYRFGPAGLRFRNPARLTLPYERAGLPPAATLESINSLYFEEQFGLWRAVRKVSPAHSGEVVSEIEHFTEFMNATMPAPDAPGVKDSKPDAMEGIQLGSPSAGVDLIAPPQGNSGRAANLELPLRLPPGVNGLEPSVALTYSSARGNSWLGMGWDLSVSSIEHDTRFGVPDYDGSQIQKQFPGATAGSLRYLLDGAQLTAVGPTAGGTRFERRVEGSFERILKLPTPADSNIFYWEVTDKTGLKSVYGKSANARLADPNNPQHVFKWSLERVEDRFGNQILFKYTQDQQAMSGVVMPALYPKRICYGTTTDAGNDCSGTYSVSFVLDAADARPDRIIDARPGFPTKLSHRLDQVDVYYQAAPIRHYDLRYTTGDFQKSLLSEVGYQGTDGSELYKHHLDYHHTDLAHPFGTPTQVQGDKQWLPTVWGSAKLSNKPRLEHQLAYHKGFSAGGGGGVGIDLGFFSASVTAGASTGKDRVRTAPLDVSGDGLLDFLDLSSGSINFSPRDALADHLKFQSISNVGSDSLGATHTGGWTAGGGIGVLGGALGLGGSIAHNESEDNHILSDLDGDGFIDQVFIEDGTVKYRPGSKNSFGAVRGYGAYDDSLITFANADRLSAQKAQYGLLDPLARWKASFAGTVAITGALNKVISGGDGVAVSIYKNSTLVWSHSIAGNDTTGCVPANSNDCNGATPLTIAVAPGDDLFFRVSSVDDTRKDAVLWSPTITYQGVSASEIDRRDPTGAFLYHTSLADDFRVVGLPKRLWFPNAPGKVAVSSPQSCKLPTPDDVQLTVFRVRPGVNHFADADKIAGPVILPAAFSGCYDTGANALTASNVQVDRGDALYFEMKSDAPVDPDRVGWNPVVRYTHYSRPALAGGTYVDGDILGCGASEQDPSVRVCTMDHDPTPDDPVLESLIVQYPDVNVASFFFQSAPVLKYAAAGTVAPGTLSNIPTLNSKGRICALVQGVNKLYSKACLNAADRTSASLPPVSGVTPGEPLYFSIVSSDPTPNAVWAPTNDGSPAPINIRALDPDYNDVLGDTDIPAPTHDMMSGGYARWSFGDYRANATFNQASLQQRNVGSDQSAFFFATASAQRAASLSDATVIQSTPAYLSGRGQGVFVAKGLFSPGRAKGGRGLSAGGGFDALRMSDTWSWGIDVSAGIPNVVGASIGAGAADTKGEVDLVDMNGDSFPDLVTRDGVQLNTGRDATGSASFTGKHGYDFDEFRKVEQASGRFSVNIDASGAAEGKQAVPQTDTRGRTRAMLSTSFSAGLEYAVSSAKIELIDINQDGLPDRVQLDPTSHAMTVRLNTGYGLTNPITWSNPAFGFDQFGLTDNVINYIGNLTGHDTGSQSARYEDTGSFSVGVSVGGGGSIGLFGVSAHVGAGYVYSLNRSGSEFMDVNNDGLLDHVARKAGESFLRVKLNLGDRFDRETPWPLPAWPSNVEGAFQGLGAQVLQTIGLSGNPETLSFASSRDFSTTFDAKVCYFFVCGSVYGFYHDTAGGSSVAWHDVDGDGLVDQVAKVDGDANVYVKLNQLGQANLLTSVTGPFGNSFEMDYARYGNELSDDTKNNDDSTRTVDLPGNHYVLAAVRSKDGRGQTLAQTFDYSAPGVNNGPRTQTGKYDRFEREDYGSSYLTVTRGNVAQNTGDGSQIESRFHNQDFYRHGAVITQLERDGAARPFMRHSFGYEDPTTGTSNQPKPAALVGSFFPAELTHTTDWFEGQATATPGKSTTETHTWNFDHGGVKTVSMTQDDGAADDLFYQVDYDTRGLGFGNASDLYLVRVKDVKARQGNASGPILRERTATYEPQTGALSAYTTLITGGGVPGGGTYNNAADTLTITRDSFGNVKTMTDANGYVLTYGYEPSGIYQTSTNDSFGYVSTSTPNYFFGSVDTTTDANAHSTRYQYDAYGRLTAVWGPNDFVADAVAQQSVVPTLKAEYGLQPANQGAPFWATMAHKDIVRNPATTTPQNHDYVVTSTFIDGFDRVIQTKKDFEKDFIDHIETGMTVSGAVAFDARGRLQTQGQPIFVKNSTTSDARTFIDVKATDPGSFERGTTWTYDILGRMTALTAPADPEDTGKTFVTTSTSYGFSTDSGGVTRLDTTTTDPRGFRTTQRRDVADRVLEVVERINATDGAPITTRYKYNAVSDLQEVDDTKNNATLATYDTAGRMVTLKNPDSGLTEWKYDLVGNVREKQTGRLRALGQKISYQYDFNRLKQITYPTSVARTYTYGTPSQAGDARGNLAGRLAKETSEAGERDFLYDAFGNVAQLDVTYNRLREPWRGPYRYQVQHRYDSFARLLRTRYPDLRGGSNPDQMALGDASREVITYTYDAGGSLQNVVGLNTKVNEQHPTEAPNTIYLNQMGYEEFGQKSHVIAGNFIETGLQYKARTRRLSQINSDERDSTQRQQNKPARPFQRLAYAYDVVGNITQYRNDAPFDPQMNSSVLVGTLKNDYQYDSLDRLKSASGTVQERSDWRFRYSQSFAYDDIHNITNKTNQSYRQVPNGSGGFRDDYPVREQTYDAQYSYASPRPHAATRMSEQWPAESSRYNRDFTYDDSGNQTKSVYRNSDTREIKWNEEDEVSQVLVNTQSLSQNLYDGTGERAVSLHQVSGLEETAYISQDLTIRDGKYLTKHVFAGSMQLASKMDSAWLNYPPTLYFHSDHLGSTQYASMDDQSLIQHDEYFPSGELWQNETDSRYELARRYVFTGKELDIGTGLYYFGARYYDGHTSQWLSPDPILQKYMAGTPNGGVFSPPNLSLYCYGRQNPIVLLDHDGRWSSKTAADFLHVSGIPIIGGLVNLLGAFIGLFVPIAGAQPVHQMAITNTLSSRFDKRTVSIMRRTQVEVDERQGEDQQHLHAMMGEDGRSPAQTIIASNNEIHGRLVNAHGAYESAAKARAAGNQAEADAQMDIFAKELGWATHVLQDATSPAHRGMQHWGGHIQHGNKEAKYPGAGTRERVELEGVTNWAADMAISGKIEHEALDANGFVRLPQKYRE